MFIDNSDKTDAESVYSIYSSEDREILLNSSEEESSSSDETIHLLKGITHFTM